MVVRPAILVGAVLSGFVPVTVSAADAERSSTAAFPVAPADSAQTNPSSRAGFPLPPSSSPTPPAAPPRAAPPPSGPSTDGTPPSPPGYPYGYGYGAGPYAPVGYGPYPTGAAYAPPEEKKPEPDSAATPSSVSLTMSAIRLILPVFEPTLEARLTDHVGFAVFGGLGEATPKILGQALVDTSDRFAVKEIGGQFLTYPLGRFDGLVLGGEVMYTKVTGTVSAQSLDVSGSALAVGPLVGGKWIHSSGFTLFAHAGVQRVWLKANSTAYGQTVTESDAIWFPLLNVNVGWSF